MATAAKLLLQQKRWTLAGNCTHYPVPLRTHLMNRFTELRKRLHSFEAAESQRHPTYYRLLQAIAGAFLLGLGGVLLAFAGQALGWTILESAGAVITLVSVAAGFLGVSVGFGMAVAMLAARFPPRWTPPGDG